VVEHAQRVCLCSRIECVSWECTKRGAARRKRPAHGQTHRVAGCRCPRDRHCGHGAAAGPRQAEEPDVAPASSLQAAHTTLCSIVHGHRRGA